MQVKKRCVASRRRLAVDPQDSGARLPGDPLRPPLHERRRRRQLGRPRRDNAGRRQYEGRARLDRRYSKLRRQVVARRDEGAARPADACEQTEPRAGERGIGRTEVSPVHLNNLDSPREGCRRSCHTPRVERRWPAPLAGRPRLPRDVADASRRGPPRSAPRPRLHRSRGPRRTVAPLPPPTAGRTPRPRRPPARLVRAGRPSHCPLPHCRRGRRRPAVRSAPKDGGTSASVAEPTLGSVEPAVRACLKTCRTLALPGYPPSKGGLLGQSSPWLWKTSEPISSTP